MPQVQKLNLIYMEYHKFSCQVRYKGRCRRECLATCLCRIWMAIFFTITSAVPARFYSTNTTQFTRLLVMSHSISQVTVCAKSLSEHSLKCLVMDDVLVAFQTKKVHCNNVVLFAHIYHTRHALFRPLIPYFIFKIFNPS